MDDSEIIINLERVSETIAAFQALIDHMKAAHPERAHCCIIVLEEHLS